METLFNINYRIIMYKIIKASTNLLKKKYKKYPDLIRLSSVLEISEFYAILGIIAFL